MERSYQSPDDIFALGDEAKTRAEVHRNFASLDGKRFFVRSLLPMAVEGYATWSVGLWIEVSKADHDRVWAAWDDPEQYPSDSFEKYAVTRGFLSRRSSSSRPKRRALALIPRSHARPESFVPRRRT